MGLCSRAHVQLYTDLWAVFFSSFDQSPIAYLHIGATEGLVGMYVCKSIGQTERLVCIGRICKKKAGLNSKQIQNILENIFEKGVSRTAHRISRKRRNGAANFASVLRTLEYLQVLSISFSGQFESISLRSL